MYFVRNTKYLLVYFVYKFTAVLENLLFSNTLSSLAGHIVTLQQDTLDCSVEMCSEILVPAL